MLSAWVGKLCQHTTYTLPFYFLLVFKSSKNMLMKDKTHSRLTGVGIYSFDTTFYAKVINIQLNKAVFIPYFKSRCDFSNIFNSLVNTLSGIGYQGSVKVAPLRHLCKKIAEGAKKSNQMGLRVS